MAKHEPTPWEIVEAEDEIRIDSKVTGNTVCVIALPEYYDAIAQATAKFIIKACNTFKEESCAKLVQK